MKKNQPAAIRRPGPFETLLDYEQRSLSHVAGRPEMVEAPGHWRGVGFRLGQRRLVSSFEEVVEILGEVDDKYIERIIDTGASVAQIGEALSDLEDELRFGEERRTETSPQAAAVRGILEELLDEDDEAVVPALSSHGGTP